MSGFRVEKVSGEKAKLRGGAKAVLCALMGIASVGGHAASRVYEVPRGGVALAPDQFALFYDEASELVDSLMSASLDNSFEHDVRLFVTNQQGRRTIVKEIRVNGYDPENRIAYIFLEYRPRGLSQQRVPVNLPDESLLEGTRYGEYDILCFPQLTAFEIHKAVSNFLKEYTNRNE